MKTGGWVYCPEKTDLRLVDPRGGKAEQSRGGSESGRGGILSLRQDVQIYDEKQEQKTEQCRFIKRFFRIVSDTDPHTALIYGEEPGNLHAVLKKAVPGYAAVEGIRL